ncbi:MAG: relaxase/mobilization nuclease domain-containing protein [Alphaproteobacteria bacterium]|nr:relaxase/mobilization nuclease domain-containing protein [Alphaproteobacteria bacterium]
MAAQLMAAATELNPFTVKPVYHLMIAWGLDEHPTPDVMQTIATRTLELAGLDEHQCLIMGHGDTPHAHLHMMINRCHPVSGKTWKPSHDWRLFDRIMRQLAGEHGFRFVPAHAFNPELTDAVPKKPNSRATYAARRGARTDRMQWSQAASRELGARLSEKLEHGAGWDDLEFALAEEGLSLEPKSRGLVVGNRTSYAKLSSLGVAATARSWGKRPSPAPKIDRDPGARKQRPIFSVDAVDITRALAAWGLLDASDVRAAIDEAQQQREARITSGPPGVRFVRDLKTALRSATSLSQARNIPSKNRRSKSNGRLCGTRSRDTC